MGINWVLFSTRNTNVYKICQICKAIFSIVYNILQPNFPILLSLRMSMLFQDVVIFLPVSNFFKILSKRSIDILSCQICAWTEYLSARQLLCFQAYSILFYLFHRPGKICFYFKEEGEKNLHCLARLRTDGLRTA